MTLYMSSYEQNKLRNTYPDFIFKVLVELCNKFLQVEISKDVLFIKIL